MSPVRAVISDFGGVLTNPLWEAFAGWNERVGADPGVLGMALQRAAEARGDHPLYQLERGELSEDEFTAIVQAELPAEIELKGFREIYFSHLHPNEPMIELMRRLRERGLRMAILTNNVREWEPLWRSMLPVDEIFELVVDSGFEGVRKPEPAIYELTLERLGLPAEATLFVDDTEVNCDAARELGMHAVHFRGTAQTIAEIEQVLAGAAAR